MAYVLIIDDDEGIGSAYSTVLEDAGHEVATELDFKNALPRMKEHAPDLVILDVMFPDDDSGGFKTARAIRESGESFKDVPILMTTGVNQHFPMGFGKDDIDTAWLPVTDFAEKPVDLDDLIDRVTKLLEK